MIRAVLLTAAVLLVACQARPANPAREAAPSVVPEAPAPPELDPVATLEGEWRVAGIDGEALDQPVGLALGASKDEIWWAPRCAGLVRSYAIDASRFAAGPARGVEARKPGEPTPPVCTIGLPPRLGDLFRAIDAAQSISRTPENGVLISGGGHSLLLFSQ